MKKECETYLRSSYKKWVNESNILASPNITNTTHRADHTPITVLPSLNLSATLNNSQNNPNDSFDIKTLLDKYNIKEAKPNDPVIDSVLKNLVSSSSLADEATHQPAKSLEDKLVNSLKQFNDSNDQSFRIENNFNKENNDNNYNNMNYANTTNQQQSYNNRLNMTSQSINLLKEYEREIKRQDTNVIENTLINTITSMNKSVELNSPVKGDKKFVTYNDVDEEESEVTSPRAAAPEGYEIKRRK